MSEIEKKQHLFAAGEDAEVFADPHAKLIICSPPRTASTFLCQALAVAGIAKPSEYFGTVSERHIRLRTSLAKSMDHYSVDSEYFHDILRRRCFNGLFATKLQYWQLKRLMRSRLSGRLFEGAHVVYLTRADLRDQMVSHTVASLTQRWGEVGATDDAAVRFSVVIRCTAPARVRFGLTPAGFGFPEQCLLYPRKRPSFAATPASSERIASRHTV